MEKIAVNTCFDVVFLYETIRTYFLLVISCAPCTLHRSDEVSWCDHVTVSSRYIAVMKSLGAIM